MGFTDHKLKFTIDADGKAARAELQGIDKLISKIGKSGGMGDVFGGNLASQAVSKLSSALVSGGQTILDYSARMEQSKIGFTTLMGGAEAANKHLKELQKFALSTPFEFQDLTVASRRLQNVGLEAQKVIPVMEDIGNAAAAAGASSAELDSISLAFSQIIAKGKLSAEEVNQLAERGIPVWKMLEEQLGKSKGEIIKLAEQGKISSEVFLEAFQRFSQANFGGAMKAQSKTFLGAMSTIKDATLQAADEGFKPLYNEIARYANRMAENEGEVQKWGQTTNQVLQSVIDGMRGANEASSEPGGFWDAMKTGLDKFDWYLRNNGAITQMYAEWAEGARKVGQAHRESEERIEAARKAGSRGWFGGAVVNAPPAAAKPPIVVGSLGGAKKSSTGDTRTDKQVYQDFVAELKNLGVTINSGFRTYAEQASLYARLPRGQAARPGTSDHEFYKAVDLPPNVSRTILEKAARAAGVTLDRSNVHQGTGLHNHLGFQKGKFTGGGEAEVYAEVQAEREFREEEDRLVREGLRALADEMIGAERQASTDRLDIRRLEAEQAVEIIEGMVLRGELTEKESIETVGRLRLDMLEEERSELQAQIPTSENQKRIEELRLEIETERLKQVNARLRSEKEISDEIEKQINSLQKANQRPGGLAKRETYQEKVDRMAMTTVGSGQEIGAMGQLHDYFVSEGNEAAIAGVDALAQAFGGLGQAIGATIEAWTLYGSAGDGAQEVTAKILASIAQQAAIKAIFELAEGFAMLGLAFFGHPGAGPSATQHFIAAGMYGAIAGGAAIMGRAVAGDSMKQGGKNGSSSSSSTGQQQRSTEPYSRVTDDAYVSGQRNTVFENLTAEIRNLRKMVQTASPGDVLVRGSQQRKGFIGTQAVDDMKTRPQLGTRMLRQANAR